MPIGVYLTSTRVTDGGLTVGSRESGVGSWELGVGSWGNVELLTETRSFPSHRKRYYWYKIEECSFPTNSGHNSVVSLQNLFDY